MRINDTILRLLELDIMSFEDEYALISRVMDSISIFPYENLSKIIKFAEGGLSLDLRRYPEEVVRDHMESGLGGTCFSLTWLLKEILDHYSIRNYLITADMKTGKNVHCAVAAYAGGVKYLLDPGYLYSKPLPMDDARSEVMDFTNAAVVRSGERLNLYTYTGYSGVKMRYVFDDIPVTETEFFRHWDASFSGRGMKNICISRVFRGKQLFFLKDFMRVSTLYEKENIKVRGEEALKVSEYFGIEEKIFKEAEYALKGIRAGDGSEPALV